MIALAVLRWHDALAWGRVAANALAGAWALAAHRWTALRGKLERILAASGLERHGFAAQLQARCESIGVTAGARTNDAAALLEPLEASAARAEPAHKTPSRRSERS